MRKNLLICFFAALFLLSGAVNKTVIKPFIEGKGMRGWLIDSIQLNTKQTLVYGHFGLGKGWTASGDLDNYLEIPTTGKHFRQTDLRGELPKSPAKIDGPKKVSFIYVFPAIPADTKYINISSTGFTGTEAAWYGVWLTPRNTVFNQQLKNISGIEGNWYKTDGAGKWLAGFYEKKVYWNNNFWNYSKIMVTNSSAQLELINANKKRLVLSVNLSDSNSLSVSDNNSKYQLAKKPVFKTDDLSIFKTGIIHNDSVTVTGYYQVANPIFSKKCALLVPELFSNTSIVYPIKLSADGLFELKIPLKYTTRITFSNQLGPQSPLSEVSFIAEPGNHIFLTYRNENEKAVVFGGDNERVNNEFQQFALKSPYVVSPKKLKDKLFTQNTKIEEITSWRTGINQKLDSSYQQWKKANTGHTKFSTLINTQLHELYYSDMLTIVSRFGNGGMADSIFNLSKSYMLAPSYQSIYTDDHLRFLQSIQKLQDSQMITDFSGIFNYVLENASMTKSERQLMDTLMRSLNLNTTMKKEVSKETQQYLKANKTKIDSIMRGNQDLVQNYFAIKKEESRLKYQVPTESVNDYLIAAQNYQILASGETTLTTRQINELRANCKNSDFVNIILEKNASNEKTLAGLASTIYPPGVTVCQLPNDSKDVIKDIAEKFKGKVIYLDCWATWCSPCKAEMEYSKKQKAELKNKNVVFVYLTGATSSEVSWKKMIREIPGTHIRLSQSQWEAFGQQYQISGIPRYMLIDKTGKIINMDAPRPSSGNVLQTEIQKLL